MMALRPLGPSVTYYLKEKGNDSELEGSYDKKVK